MKCATETIISTLFKEAMPLITLMEIEREPVHREELARRMHKGTSYLRDQINPLLSLGFLSIEQKKNMKIYHCTEYGSVTIALIRVLKLTLDLPEDELASGAHPRIRELMSYILRSLNGELFDREVAKSLDPSSTLIFKLRTLVLTIHPHREFTLDELIQEYMAVFPSEKLKKSNVSTCIARFRDKNNRHYIPNLYCKGKSTYILE